MMGVAAQDGEDQCRDCRLGMARLFRSRPGAERASVSTWPKYRRPDPRTAPAKAKAVGLYMICTLSKHDAERQGYADALMLDWRGQVAECTGANIFFVKNGELHTPTPDCFLDGITRRTVIGLARATPDQGHRAGDPARGDVGLRAMFHRRHGRGGDAGVGDRSLFRFEVGDITRTLRERLSGRGSAEERRRHRAVRQGILASAELRAHPPVTGGKKATSTGMLRAHGRAARGSGSTAARIRRRSAKAWR